MIRFLNIIGIIFLVVSILAITTWVVIYLFFRKWSCKDGNCEKEIGGKHDTLTNCQKSCQTS